MTLRRLLAAAAVAVLAVAVPHASSSPVRWAPVATAAIHPGVQTVTGDAQCTANFVFQARGVTYLGQAAHCAGTGSATDTNGCTSPTLPLGTPVSVGGHTGTLAYSSWVAMKRARTTDPSTCAYNDLALIRLPASAVRVTNPSVPFFGGPTGLATGTGFGDKVYSYGNSSLRFGLTPTSPKRGISLGDSGDGWTSTVYTVTPGIPGDSGSGFLDAQGRALGVLSTVGLTPFPLDNGVGKLAKEIAFARTHGVPGLTLVNGTQRFNAGGLL
jgi:hypothetical protein